MSPLEPAWYCVRSQPKHEHIAAASLRRIEEIEVFNPRVRVRRPTYRRTSWVIEPLFPGYLFAKFALQPALDLVRYSFGVKTVVRFGDKRPTIDDRIIQDLRERLGGVELIEHETELTAGEEVSIAAGPFQGLTAVVQKYLPASQRVRVLLEFLGQPTTADLAVASLNLGHRPVPCLKLEWVAA